ncbi:ribosome biogenesis protein WDR12 homolog [Bacillus rossius redtenbacheri]|uniref:ribosome biogenesis protein WDR12 homolog n=1 Tax=Bacillus rossius redtenbacheri TaxID=93214 RepID=UPI002FDD3B25
MDEKISAHQLQIRFFTKQPKYAVPSTTFAVPSTLASQELSSMINEILKGAEAGDGERKEVVFDFLVHDVVLRTQLLEHVQEHGLSTETVLDVEYVEHTPPPEPLDCLLHDDWVSAVHVRGRWILCGCYDNTIHIWTTKGKHILTIPGHSGPVKAVSWISLNENIGTFVSASHDQTAMLWEWNVRSNEVECVHVCRGHERGLECVGVNSSAALLATGGWDTMLKIWPAEMRLPESAEGESSSKRLKTDHGKFQVRTPVMTLAGHKEAVSAVAWTGVGELCTASWDHTLRLWDAETGGLKADVVGNKPFFDAAWSPLSNLLASASADRHVRIYDPRSTEGSLVKLTCTSHTQWVQSVRWSATHQHHFISGAYDHKVKFWDTRSPKAALYDLSGHEDKVLCCDWSEPDFMVSGGADNTVRIFRATHAIAK